MTDLVGLIGCSKSKRGADEPDREFPARDLYDSWLFDGRVEAVTAHCSEWAIFSAEHGLVEPDDRLTWYDTKITDLTPEERRRLAADVVDELPETDRLLILMGRDYADPLTAVLPDDVEVWDPLEGVQLFDQRGALRDLASVTDQPAAMTDGGYYEPPRNTGCVHDPGPDPEDACIECGEYGVHRCGCCGFPLCGRHHEVGGGFCSHFHSVGGVPVCVYDNAVYVGVFTREEMVLVTTGDSDVYHLPNEEDSKAPACRPAEDSKSRISLSLLDEFELCDRCETEARQRREDQREQLQEEFDTGDDDLRADGGTTESGRVRGQGGLNSEEVDDLSIKIEELVEDDETDESEVILWILRALPDSEWGQGQYDEDRMESHLQTGTDENGGGR